MSASAELIRAAAVEAYKREVDRDEAVWRSLPFFAAAFGLAAGGLRFATQSLPKSAESTIWGVFLVAAPTIALFTSFLWFAAIQRPRQYRIPVSQADLARYRRDLASFGPADDDAAADELRLFIADDYGAARTRCGW